MNALILLRDFQNSQVEFWRKIEGFPGYDVSNFGRVRRWWCRAKGGKRGATTIGGVPKIVSQTKQWQGYVRVYLYRPQLTNSAVKNGCQNRSCHFLHRLVARTFIENSGELPEVNHKNLVKSDCRSDNLEFASRESNMEHARASGRSTRSSGPRLKTHASEIRQRIADGERYGSIAVAFNTSWRSIYNIASGKTHSHTV